jgi:hypothetical protein
MAGRITFIGAIALALSACRTVGHVIIDAADRFVRFIFDAVSPEPTLALEGGNEGYVGHAFTFADPHVDRHEAGMSRRAAARGK